MMFPPNLTAFLNCLTELVKCIEEILRQLHVGTAHFCYESTTPNLMETQTTVKFVRDELITKGIWLFQLYTRLDYEQMQEEINQLRLTACPTPNDSVLPPPTPSPDEIDSNENCAYGLIEFNLILQYITECYVSNFKNQKEQICALEPLFNHLSTTFSEEFINISEFLQLLKAFDHFDKLERVLQLSSMGDNESLCLVPVGRLIPQRRIDQLLNAIPDDSAMISFLDL